jgi:hypothetical protein
MKLLLVFALLAASLAAQQAPLETNVKGAHSIALSCTASPSTGVTGYNFYRGTASGAESSTPLNAAPMTACAYTDTTAAASTTYFYVSKAFCNTCSPSLSAASNEASGTTQVDPQPLPPTGLTVGTITAHNVPLHWVAPPTQLSYTVIAYAIYRGTQPTLPGPAILRIVPANTQNYADTTCSHTCYYEVKSYNIKSGLSYAYSPPSNIVSAVQTRRRNP